MRNTNSLRVLGVLGLSAAAVLAGCGDDQDTPPTAEQLAAQLVTVDSFDGDWAINASRTLRCTTRNTASRRWNLTSLLVGWTFTSTCSGGSEI